MGNKIKYTILNDGAGWEVLEDTKKTVYFSCCDCGLVHKLKIKHKNSLIVHIYRDDKKTERRRKEIKNKNKY